MVEYPSDSDKMLLSLLYYDPIFDGLYSFMISFDHQLNSYSNIACIDKQQKTSLAYEVFGKLNSIDLGSEKYLFGCLHTDGDKTGLTLSRLGFFKYELVGNTL